MANPAARCPDCGNFMQQAFIDDVDQQMVYQCRTVGVLSERKIGRDEARVFTLDHDDRFFKHNGLGLIRVLPVRLGRDASKAVHMGHGLRFERDEITGKEIVPTAWTTRNA